jgi:hypothetical protein
MPEEHHPPPPSPKTASLYPKVPVNVRTHSEAVAGGRYAQLLTLSVSRRRQQKLEDDHKDKIQFMSDPASTDANQAAARSMSDTHAISSNPEVMNAIRAAKER